MRKRLSLLLMINVFVGSSVFALSDYVGWGCGGSDDLGGIILCTTNCTDWFRQGVGQITSNGTSGICSTDGGKVWVVGEPENDYSAIYHSPNYGANWFRQGDETSLPNQTLQKVCVVGEDVVWAVGTIGTVVRTVNGGKTWKDVSVSGFSTNLQGVAAINAQTAWVSGESDSNGYCGIFRTINSGTNWTRLVDAAITNVNHLLGLDAVDANHIWAIGENQTVLYSSDAGNSWTQKFSNTQKDGNEVFAVGTNQIFAACDAQVLWSKDNGNSWTNHTTWEYTLDVNTPDGGTNIWAIRGNHDGGQIYHSPDGGQNWTSQFQTNSFTSLFTLTFSKKTTPVGTIVLIK